MILKRTLWFISRRTMETDNESIKYLFPADTKVIHFTGTPDKYTALLRSRCKNKEEFRQNWLNEFEKLSRVTMRVLLTRPKTGKTVVYKAAYRCQHNTYPTSHQRVKAPHRKHTGCQAVLKVTIKATPENRRVRSIDTLRGEYPTIISIKHDHNHILPDKVNFSGNYYQSCQKSVRRLSEINCEAVSEAWINSEVKKEEKLEIEELNWNFLKHCWSSFLEKCESSNSVHLYRALLKATNSLENCKTVNATIAALNSIGKKVKREKCDTEIVVKAEAAAKRQKPCLELNVNNDNFSLVDVPNVVDELLVIDQGWIG